MNIDLLRATEYPALDAGAHVYLDYTGANLVPQSLLREHQAVLRRCVLGNPHSASPTSRAATSMVERARAAVLGFFGADPDEYTIIWTPNATGACRLVGEAYPWGPGRRLLLPVDNHNSVLGLREFACRKHSEVAYAPLRAQTLRLDEMALSEQLRAATGLFAFPAQSNFSGVQHDLDWISRAQSQGWIVLLDAAAFVPTNPLNLSRHHPDFVALSFYKLFGYPTGIGALIARRAALATLHRPWFAGGTVLAASAQGGWHAPAPGGEAFEDGTLNFLAMPAVEYGVTYLHRVGIEWVREHTYVLTSVLLNRLTKLRHTGGSPVVRLYGPPTTWRRGATVTFNFLDLRGNVVDERLVERGAYARGISLRTGCFCNPGAGEMALGVDPHKLAQAGAVGKIHPDLTLEDYIEILGLPSGGAIRVSLGIASNLADVTHFLDFAETFVDLVPDLSGLPARTHC